MKPPSEEMLKKDLFRSAVSCSSARPSGARSRFVMHSNVSLAPSKGHIFSKLQGAEQSK
jgi:hypothetical protein